MKIWITAGMALASVAAMANSFTVATFADPSGTSSNPVIYVDVNAFIIYGGWNQPGLTLETPGLIGGGSVSNAQFTMSTTSLTSIISGVYAMGSGTINFTDSSLNPVLNIAYTKGLVVLDGGAGSSDLRLDGVTFSGPNVPAGLSQEMYNFSFANGFDNGQFVHSYTASFTSSAVPEPASMIALGAGLLALARRRRRA